MWAPSHGQHPGGRAKPASLSRGDGWALALPTLPLGPAGAGGRGWEHGLKVSWVMPENKANWSRQGPDLAVR